MASRRSAYGLNMLNFFTANVQTGFGPFIASYLTTHKWTDGEIGTVLSVGTFTAMLSQVPAGALLDRTRHKRAAASAAILAIAGCAVLLGAQPDWLPVLVAEVLHGFASCVMPPAVAAISLALVGRAGIGEQLGRNARWGAIGNAAAAALLGACGHFLSIRSIFWLTALLALPAVAALAAIRPDELARPSEPHEPPPRPRPRSRLGTRFGGRLGLFGDRRLIAFGGCAALFQLANAELMPLAASGATQRAGSTAELIIAGAIVAPQIVTAILSPWVGRAAQGWGRRAVLLIGFAALPVRAALLALLPQPGLLVPLQALDGISAAVFGVMLPLIAADLTRGRDGFNLCIGALGLASGIGGTLGTLLGGRLADAAGSTTTFLALAATGLAAWLLVLLAMPETRPETVLGEPVRRPSPVA